MAPALARQAYTADVWRLDVREIDIDEVAGLPRAGQEALQDRRCAVPGRCQAGGLPHLEHLAHGDGPHTKDGALHRCRRRARIDGVLGEVLAMVDAGEHDGRRKVLEDLIERQQHAIGGAALDCVMALIEAPHAQGSGQGDRVRGPGVLFLGGDHPDVVGELTRQLLEQLEPLGADAIVIDQKDAVVAEILGRGKAGHAGASVGRMRLMLPDADRRFSSFCNTKSSDVFVDSSSRAALRLFGRWFVAPLDGCRRQHSPALAIAPATRNDVISVCRSEP